VQLYKLLRISQRSYKGLTRNILAFQVMNCLLQPSCAGLKGFVLWIRTSPGYDLETATKNSLGLKLMFLGVVGFFTPQFFLLHRKNTVCKTDLTQYYTSYWKVPVQRYNLW